MNLALVCVDVVAPQEGLVAYVATITLSLWRVHGQVAVVVAFV